jgi:hypothetical protein
MYYLLYIHEWFGQHETVSPFLIKASDRQDVKFAYHYIQKEAGGRGGFMDGKHTIKMHDDYITDIEEIRQISVPEWDTMKRHIPEWENPKGRANGMTP